MTSTVVYIVSYNNVVYDFYGKFFTLGVFSTKEKAMNYILKRIEDGCILNLTPEDGACVNYLQNWNAAEPILRESLETNQHCSGLFDDFYEYSAMLLQ